MTLKILSLNPIFFLWLPVAMALEFPSSITLRAGVLHAPPFAMIQAEEYGDVYDGFQIQMLQSMKTFARRDNVELDFVFSPSPPQYGDALDLVANDCNTTVNPNSQTDCNQYDVIIGDYYVNPDRSIRVDFTPSWLRTTMTTIKYIEKNQTKDYTTLTQADQDGATVCVPDGTYLMTVVMSNFPNANYLKCSTQQDCIDELKNEKCVLYAEDELQLRYRAVQDNTLKVTREQLNTQYLVWPMSYRLDPVVSMLLKRWVYAAVTSGTLDELYYQYFEKHLCPQGTAGENCELPCDPNHGKSDERGVCVCESSRWTGDDCSVEVIEDLNLIPRFLHMTGMVMFGINCVACLVCGTWLIMKRNTAQVKFAQPTFLALVLLGCLISSSTIIPLGMEDEGDGPVKGKSNEDDAEDTSNGYLIWEMICS